MVVRLNKQVMLSPEFLELWSKIKQKTAYRVSIDTEQLVENCVKAIRNAPISPKPDWCPRPPTSILNRLESVT